MRFDRFKANVGDVMWRLSLGEQTISQRAAPEGAPLHREALDGHLRLETEDR
jgi:hypothetical protein